MSLPRKGIKRQKLPSKGIKPRKTEIGLWREWFVPDGAYRRYRGLKGIYWYYFSKTIRTRDYEEHGGLCMTCLMPVEKGSDQCGHLFPAKDCGFGLLFHPLNNHLQHSKCNNPRLTPSAGILNTLNITKRYGVGTIEMLAEHKKQKTKEWNKKEYEKRIRKLPAFRLWTNTLKENKSQVL